ncbi:MAG: hypothetical protein A3B90_00155 [Candidatus Magasanikbacteria bacterium RIFCSPHIGHO2_02_FULL_41_13]|uniref:Uncharacterized protein n=1 Tax=Candidatus Magasanikbacteria bacterium RIFCSPHIGHO2_02_FULL_41_13 TaxID=1798676 RepID=A0A1F6M428_9BACT|nr:MAG: hypothetical protein A3B90_00155 [Candidatus Magasanikbacteria bacterium RIFCSPHIGHO2_02_FULL_41_13]
MILPLWRNLHGHGARAGIATGKGVIVKIKKQQKLRVKIQALGEKVLRGEPVRSDRVEALKAKAPTIVAGYPHL